MARKKTVRIDQKTDAFLDIDVQTTFMPAHDGFGDGGLAVPGGHLILPVMERTDDRIRMKFATVDRHGEGHICLADSYVGYPANETLLTAEMVKDWTPEAHRIAPHAKFSLDYLRDEYLPKTGGQMLWSWHGDPGTHEGRLHPSRSPDDYLYVLVKGTDPLCDSYSGIRDNLKRDTGLVKVIKGYRVKRLFLRGIAFKFCVGFTALDAAAEGFEVFILEDCTADLPGDASEMRKRLKAAGVKVIRSDQLRSF